MPDISKITLPSGTTYDIKDLTARNEITDIKNSITGAMHYIGITTTTITNNSTTSTITIDEENITLTTDDAGAVAIFGDLEFVWSGNKWQEFGSTGSLKALAFKDNAKGTYDKITAASVNIASTNATVAPADEGTITYTPEGTISTPQINVNTAGNTTNVIETITTQVPPTEGMAPANNAITYYDVTDEVLSFYQIIPSQTPVKTTDATYTATQPNFTGTGVRLVTSDVAEAKSYNAALTVDNTAEITVS